MALWQEIAEYVIAFIDIVAWPTAALIVFFALRPNLDSLFSLITAIRFKGFEIDLDQRMRDAVEDIKLLDSTELPPLDQISSAILDPDPRFSVMASWAFIEAAIDDLAEEILDEELNTRQLSTSKRIEMLRQSNVIDGLVVSVLHDLKTVRDLVAHSENAVISEHSVQEFVRAATRVESIIEERRNNTTN